MSWITCKLQRDMNVSMYCCGDNGLRAPGGRTAPRGVCSLHQGDDECRTSLSKSGGVSGVPWLMQSGGVTKNRSGGLYINTQRDTQAHILTFSEFFSNEHSNGVRCTFFPVTKRQPERAGRSKETVSPSRGGGRGLHWGDKDLFVCASLHGPGLNMADRASGLPRPACPGGLSLSERE